MSLRRHLLAASLALAALSLSPPQRPPVHAVPAPEIPDEAALAAPAEEGQETAVEAPRAPRTPTLPIEETGAPVPKDLQVLVRADKAAGWTVTLTWPRHLVTLRRLDQRRAGEDRVSFKVARGDEESAPLVWEATGLDGLSTTRGTLRLDGAGYAALHLATPPRVIGAIEKHKRHSCQAQDDGFGGQSVLCRVEAWVTAVNDIRLALGTMLDVGPDGPHRLPAGHPMAGHLDVYQWLTVLQEYLVLALMDKPLR